MPTQPTHAITVKQPYASLLIRGIKTIETRSKPTSYRGPILLHVSKYWHPFGPGLAKNVEVTPYLSGLSPQNSTNDGFNISSYESLPVNVILGVIEIIDCLPAWEMLQKWRENKGEYTAAIDWGREEKLGDLGSEMYAYEIRVLTVFENLLPARGQLGIYNIEKVNPGITKKLNLLY